MQALILSGVFVFADDDLVDAGGAVLRVALDAAHAVVAELIRVQVAADAFAAAGARLRFIQQTAFGLRVHVSPLPFFPLCENNVK